MTEWEHSFLRTYQLDQSNRNIRSEFLNTTTTLPNYVIWNNQRSQIRLHLHKKIHMYTSKNLLLYRTRVRAIMAQATKHWPLLKTYFTPFLCVYDRGAGATCGEAVHCCWPPWAAVLVKVVALKIDTVVAVPELLREEKMLALLLETQ